MEFKEIYYINYGKYNGDIKVYKHYYVGYLNNKLPVYIQGYSIYQGDTVRFVISNQLNSIDDYRVIDINSDTEVYVTEKEGRFSFVLANNKIEGMPKTIEATINVKFSTGRQKKENTKINYKELMASFSLFNKYFPAIASMLKLATILKNTNNDDNLSLDTIISLAALDMSVNSEQYLELVSFGNKKLKSMYKKVFLNRGGISLSLDNIYKFVSIANILIKNNLLDCVNTYYDFRFLIRYKDKVSTNTLKAIIKTLNTPSNTTLTINPNKTTEEINKDILKNLFKINKITHLDVSVNGELKLSLQTVPLYVDKFIKENEIKKSLNLSEGVMSFVDDCFITKRGMFSLSIYKNNKTYPGLVAIGGEDGSVIIKIKKTLNEDLETFSHDNNVYEIKLYNKG